MLALDPVLAPNRRVCAQYIVHVNIYSSGYPFKLRHRKLFIYGCYIWDRFREKGPNAYFITPRVREINDFFGPTQQLAN